MINWADCPEVEARPGVVWGKWCFKSTRLPLFSLFGTLGDITVDEFCDWYPYVTPEQVYAVLDFVRDQTKISAFSHEENWAATEAAMRRREAKEVAGRGNP